MAHRQKQFQVKSLAKHWNSITSLRSGIFKKNKLKGVHSEKKLKSQWHTCRRVEDFHEVVADFESCP